MKTTINSKAQNGGTNRRAGFTLAEVMVGVGVGAIMLLSLYACFSFCFMGVRASRENVRATQITLERLERVRLCPYPQVTASTFTEAFNPEGEADGKGGIEYTGSVTVRQPSSSEMNAQTYRTNMLLVTAVVTWTSGNRQISLTNQTYVAKNGIQRYVARIQ